MNSPDLRKLASKYNIPYKEFERYWQQAVEEANDMGEGDNTVYILKTLQQILGLNESIIRKNYISFIEKKYLESNNLYIDDLFEDMVKSSIPQDSIPEVINKKDKQEESINSLLREYKYLYEEADNDEIISSFLKNAELEGVDEKQINLYCERLIEWVKEETDLDNKKEKLLNQFVELIKKATKNELEDKEKQDLVDFLKFFFPEDDKKEIKEDVLDQVNDVFGSAFGPIIRNKLVDFVGTLGEFAREVGENAWEDAKNNIEELKKKKQAKKKNKTTKKDKTKDKSTEKDKDFDFSGDDNKNLQDKSTDKELTPDEFYKKYNKCPDGYSFDSEKKSCVKN